MKKLSLILLVAMIGGILVGCSGGGEAPAEVPKDAPKKDDSTPAGGQGGQGASTAKISND